MDRLEISSVLADKAICDIQASSYINSYALFKYAVYRLLPLDTFGHDEVQSTLNRLLVTEKQGSYLLSDGFAMPHLVIDALAESNNRIGWFVSKEGIPYGTLGGDLVYVWLFIIGSERFVRNVSTLAVEICKGREFLNVVTRLNDINQFREYIRNRVSVAFGIWDSGIPAIFDTADEIDVRDVTLTNKLGIHARATAKFVWLAERFECEIVARRMLADGCYREVNAKSMMGIMMLAAGCGTTIQIAAKGKGALDAVSALAGLVEQSFGEDWCTTIRATCDVGFGRELYLRGSHAPLSWLRGVKMRCTQGSHWEWQSPDIPIGMELEYKVLIDDQVWQVDAPSYSRSKDGNFLVTGGTSTSCRPQF